MAKFKKVRFLEYFNKPRVIVAFEIDTIMMALGSLLIPYFSMTLTAMVSQGLALLLSIVIGFVATRSFVKYKTEYPKGYLKHKFYVLGLYRVNSEKYKNEVESMDIKVEDYYPQSNIKVFTE